MKSRFWYGYLDGVGVVVFDHQLPEPDVGYVCFFNFNAKQMRIYKKDAIRECVRSLTNIEKDSIPLRDKLRAQTEFIYLQEHPAAVGSICIDMSHDMSHDDEFDDEPQFGVRTEWVDYESTVNNYEDDSSLDEEFLYDDEEYSDNDYAHQNEK